MLTERLQTMASVLKSQVDVVDCFKLSDGSEIFAFVKYSPELYGSSNTLHKIIWSNNDTELINYRLGIDSTEFITSIMDIFRQAFKTLLPSDLSVPFHKMNEYSADYRISKALREKSQMFTAFTLIAEDDYTSCFGFQTKLPEIVKNHCEKWKYKEITTKTQLKHFLYPVYMHHGPQMFDTMIFFRPVANSYFYDNMRSLRKIIVNKNDLSFLKKVYSGVVMPSFEDTKISEIPSFSVDKLGTRDDKIFTGILELPLKTRKYRDYLLGLTGRQIRHLFGRYPPSTSASNAMLLSEEILKTQESDNVNDHLDAANELYKSLYVKITDRGDEAAKVNQINGMCLRNAKNKNVVRFLQSWVDDLSSEVTVDAAMEVLALFSKGKSSGKWLTNISNLDFVCSVMPSKLSSIDLIDLARQISKENITFSAQDWIKIADTIDVVKDTPVSWWKSII